MPLVNKRCSSQNAPVLMKGVIIKITLRNFVSYDYIEIVPGPRLNLILGPNGAGKSSIISAIVLGLGGNAKDLGKEINIKDLIRNGASSARIKIELFNPDGDNYIICRSLCQSRSTWTLNGVPVSMNEIQDLAKSLNIQVDNLCQILPQEKVVNFSKITHPLLLKDTENSIGPVELRDYHEKLIHYSSRMKGNENELSITKGMLEEKERECEKLKTQVANLRERETQLKRVEELKVKRAWLRYYHKKEELEEFKIRMEESKKSLEECRASETRIIKVRDTAEKRAMTVRNDMKSTTSAVSNNSVLIDRISSEVDDIKDKFHHCEQTLKLKADEKVKREHELEMVKQHIVKLENDQLAFKKPDDSIRLEIKKCDVEIGDLRESMNKLESDIAKHKGTLEYIKHDIRAQEAACAKASNVKRHREETLAKHFPEVYQGVKWLRENKHLFSGNVFEPMLLEINIPNSEHAKYFEYIIPMRDLQAFTCEDKDDMRILISKLRDEMKLKINVVHSGKEHPASHTYKPDIPIQNLRQFGFFAYLKDLFSAPETLMKYLCRRVGIHKIPLGTASTNQLFEQVPLHIRAFFSHDTKYDVTVSKYSRERCTTATNVAGRRLLNNTVDMKMVQQAEERLASLHRDRDERIEELSRLEEQKQTIELNLDTVKEKRKILYDVMNARNEFGIRLKMKRKQLATLTEELSKIETQTVQCKSKITTAIHDLFTIMGRYREAVKNHLTFVKKGEKFECELMDARKEISQANTELESLKFKHKDTLTKVRVMEEEYGRIKSATESALKRALELSPGQKPGANLRGSSSLEKVEQQLNEAMAKVTCLGHVNVEVIKLYEEVMNEIDKLKREIEHNSTAVNSLKEKVNDLKGKWFPLVRKLIQKLNDNFGKYYTAMGCAGEVVLENDDDPDNFESYGIRIHVKYRDDDSEFFFLDKYLQSGGEKTVATALYLIAMQELTCTPFRCVDEINQGMDPQNERRVFNTLVSAIQSNNSQYFFLTPKLLPELSYSKDVTTIFIYCGISSLDYQDDGADSDEDSDTFSTNTSKSINISQCLEFYESNTQ